MLGYSRTESDGATGGALVQALGQTLKRYEFMKTFKM